MHSKQIKLLVFLTLMAIVAAMPGLSWGASATLDISISVGTDDAEEDWTAGSEGNMNLTSDDLDMITDPGNGYTDRLIGLRFQNVTIPHGATIDSAYIKFVVDETDSDAADLTFWGEDVDNSDGFSSTDYDISNRTKTVTYVEWSVPEWTTVGDEHKSEDLTDIVKEITDRSGWTSGNAMTFIIGGAADSHRVAESYEAGSSLAPVLHVEYTSTVIDAFPADSSDDAEESNRGEVDLDDDQLELIREEYSDQSVGIRFTNVGVPQGAIITSAYLEFTAPVDSSDSGGRRGRGTTSLVIHSENTDDAAQFDTSYRNVSNRDQTSQYIEWNSLPSWTADNDYTSPDISVLVQEIVGRSGWSSGNAMAFIITGRGSRIAESYDGADGDASRMPRLHIEYYEDIYPNITVDKTVLGDSCYYGKNPAAGEFTITNTGGGAMNYTLSVDDAWLTLSQTSGTLAVGESVTITVTYNVSAKDVGTYGTTITIEDSAAANSPVEIAASVSVFELPEETSCDHIPLYATDIVSPSILILLDVSGSMATMMNVQVEDFPQTPDLSAIVQEIVDRAAWSEGNAMAFIITGSGERNVVAYDGESGYAPLLHVEYNDGVDDYTLEVAVNQSSDDAEEGDSGHMYLTSNDLDLVYDTVDQTVGIRFQNVNIPPGVTITKAYMELTISESGDTDTDLVIKGEDSDNADTFAGGWTGGRGGGTWENSYNITSRTTTTAEVAWDDIEAWEGAAQKSRIDIGKSAISSLVTDRQISWGFGTWSDLSTTGYTSDIDYTKIHVGCKTHDDAHQTALQTAIEAATTQRATPFQPSLAAGRKYFTEDKADEDGDYYVNNDCESLVVVEVTDGLGNTGTTLEGVEDEAELLAANNISLVTVGFGIDDATQINAAAAIANEWGNLSDEDKLYALHEEEDDGTGTMVGVPFLANNESELIDALSSIKSNVLDNLFHGSAPAPTTTTDLGNVLLVATFNASDWSGNLEAVSTDENGDWTDESGAWLNPIWSAVDEMPASRSIFTVDPSDSASIVEYTEANTGYDYLDDFLFCKDLGDIINSTPIVVNKPGSYYDFDDYRDFATGADSVAADRDSMVYVGANDGALHAFSLNTGIEQWAFVPEILQAKLEKGETDVNYDMCDVEYCHQYYVDGSPQVADVYTSGSWKTILVSGLGEGGEAYFALDITSGNSFVGSNPSLYMWEFTDTDLGESWSKPSINRVNISESEKTWAVFFGSGYATTAAAQVDKEAYLYGIEAEDMDPLWTDEGGTDINKIRIFDKILLNYDGVSTDFTVGETINGAGASATVVAVDSLKGVLELESLSGTFIDNETLTGTLGGSALVNGEVQDSLLNDALASPLVADIDGGGSYIADQIYVGNLYGTMYRVSDIDFGETPQVSTLVDLGLTSNDLSPIRAKANYAFSEYADEIWVYWGTGIYETQVDKVNLEQQYFFGVRDQLGATDAVELDDMAALEAKYITYTDPDTSVETTYRYIDGINPAKDSWYIKLDTTSSGLTGSERILKSSLVAGGTVFFTTFIPGSDVCTGSGEAWLFAVDYETGLPPGLPTTDVNGDGVINWFDVYGIMDQNGDGVVDCTDLEILDPNRNGVADPGDMVRDVNGDGNIDWYDVVGILDVDGDGDLEDEIVDTDGDGPDWDDLDIGYDVNGDGTVDYNDFGHDENGDGLINWDDVEDVNGDGDVDCWDLGDLNRDGVIDWSDVNGDYEPVFDVNGDGVIDENDIVFDGDGNPVPVAGVALGDDDGGGIASNPVLSGNDELFVNLTESGSEEVDVNLPALAVRLESWRHEF